MIRIIGNGKSPNGKKIPDKENDRRYIGDVGEAHAAECLKKLHYAFLLYLFMHNIIAHALPKFGYVFPCSDIIILLYYILIISLVMHRKCRIK